MKNTSEQQESEGQTCGCKERILQKYRMFCSWCGQKSRKKEKNLRKRNAALNTSHVIFSEFLSHPFPLFLGSLPKY